MFIHSAISLILVAEFSCLIRKILNCQLALLIVQVFGQISDQSAWFLMERQAVGWIILAVFFFWWIAYDSNELKNGLLLYYAIMYLNMRKANVGVRMIALANRLTYHHAIA